MRRLPNQLLPTLPAVIQPRDFPIEVRPFVGLIGKYLERTSTVCKALKLPEYGVRWKLNGHRWEVAGEGICWIRGSPKREERADVVDSVGMILAGQAEMDRELIVTHYDSLTLRWAHEPHCGPDRCESNCTGRMLGERWKTLMRKYGVSGGRYVTLAWLRLVRDLKEAGVRM